MSRHVRARGGYDEGAMNTRLPPSAAVGVASIASSTFAQAPRVAPAADNTSATKNWTPPRTPWGEPDLQGTYSNKTITPLERPAGAEGPEVYTRQALAAREAR